MLTMALAGRFVGEWCGDPTAVVDYGVRFQRPVVVPDTDSGVEVTFGGEVLEIRADAVVVSVTAATADGPVLRDATATIRVVGGDMSRNGGATR
jgi:acyl dehydratase